VCYALTSSVAGFVSGSLYKRSRGDSWIRCFVMTCTIMPVPVVAVALALNFIAIAYKFELSFRPIHRCYVLVFCFTPAAAEASRPSPLAP
jgi:hypothetical protein